MMLGFFIVSLANDIAGERALIGSLMLPVAIAGVPLLDVILAIWRRSSRWELQKAQGEYKKGGFFQRTKTTYIIVCSRTNRPIAGQRLSNLSKDSPSR